MDSSTGAAAGSSLVFIIQIALIVLILIGMWKLFTKAGKPGWAAIVPFYNYYVLIQIAGLPWWWFLLLFIPVVNAVASILLIICVAQKFRRGPGTMIGLVLLPMIFICILAFGDAEYDESAPTFINS